MRYRLLIITALAFFSVTVLGLPWVISVSKLNMDESQSVLTVYPGEDPAVMKTALPELRQHPDVEEIIPLMHLEGSLRQQGVDVRVESFRPHVVSVPTATAADFAAEPALLVPRSIGDQNLAHLSGSEVELSLIEYDDEGRSETHVLPVKIVGVFDQGWSSLPPETVLASPALVKQVDFIDQTIGPFHVVLKPQVDSAATIDDIFALGLNAQEESLSIGTEIFSRVLPWVVAVAFGLYILVLARQIRKVATEASLSKLGRRWTFIRYCLSQTLVGGMVGIGLGVGLCALIAYTTFLRDLSLESSIWFSMVGLLGSALTLQAVIVAIIAAVVWRQALESNSLEHFAELFA
ncbi:hypothetical protein [Micrococcoides hystricis]|uniref:ABC transporter permease n=1 Tax=Micrococcoides hystricis TaxID=1572761 RepID=A0ABV6PA73_9MICC